MNRSKRRCLNCMKIFEIPAGHEEENNCCPFCGYVEDSQERDYSLLKPGFILRNRYVIGTLIGSGGFGITYRAWDQVLETIVAIKEYYPRGIAHRNTNGTVSISSSSDSENYEKGKIRFLREARGLARFKKVKNTVEIYDIFEANETVYMIMEFLDGCNMLEYQKENGSIVSFDIVLKMADDICDALTSIHADGIIHRDISPDNIFMCKDGSFRLIDFGAIKPNYEDSQKSETVILKHGYAPIEQYSKEGKIGVWTDLYAFSATIYALLSGKKPQEAPDRLMGDEVKDLCTLNIEVPRGFSDAVKKAMSMQYKDRYYSVEDFKAALHKNNLIDGFDGIGGTPYIITKETPPARQKSKNTAVIIISVVVTCILMLVVFQLTRGNKGAEESTETIVSSETDKDAAAFGNNQKDNSNGWKVSVIVNASDTDTTNHYIDFPHGTDVLYFHFRFENGDSSGLNIKTRMTFPNGSVSEATDLVQNNSAFYRAIVCKNGSGDRTPFGKGVITCEVTNLDSGELMNTVMINIR